MGIYKKLVVSPDRKHLLGGILVGDASSYGQLLQLAQNQIVLPPAPETLILPVHFPTPTVGLIKADGERFDYRFKRD